MNDPHSRAGGIVWGVLDVDDSEMGDYAAANHAIEYLSQAHDEPFFLACGFYRPHMPWQVPREYYDMFPVEEVTLPDVPSDDLDDVPQAGVRMARPQRDHADVTGSDNCGAVALSSAVLVREDVRRGVSDQSARHAVVIPRYQVPASPGELRLGFEPGRASPEDSRPLVSILRI